eukprot:8672143-Pyramimonas_sp.AAC.1
MRLGSWNLNKAGEAHFNGTEILHHMRACGGLFAFQETQYLVHGEFERLGWRIKASSCSKAALIFDRSWAAAVPYLPDPHVEECVEIAAGVYGQITRARDGLRAKFPQASFCVLLDANVEIQPGCKLVCNGEEYEATGKEGTRMDRKWGR